MCRKTTGRSKPNRLLRTPSSTAQNAFAVYTGSSTIASVRATRRNASSAVAYGIEYPSPTYPSMRCSELSRYSTGRSYRAIAMS